MEGAERDPDVPVYALIPAAGRGKRMGGERKQFRVLGDAPVVVQTARAFHRHPDVDHVLVAAPPDGLDELESMLDACSMRADVRVVEGASSRQQTVAGLLRFVTDDEALVLVHDAVRPFVSSTLIRAVIEEASGEGAAAPAISVRDTLRRSGPDGRFGTTVDREGLYRMQTPQGFARALLADAHASVAGGFATDDVGLVQAIGRDVVRVPGDTVNFKITTLDDWRVARALWPWWTTCQDNHVP